MLATPHSDKRRKKTTATYGKAVRRQGPAHLVSAYDLSSDFQDVKIQLPVRPIFQKEREAKPAVSKNRQSSATSTDVFDFPSDSDDVVSPVRTEAKTVVSSNRQSSTARPDVVGLQKRREKEVQSPEPSKTESVVSKKRQSPTTPADVFDFPSGSDNGTMSLNRIKKRKLSPKVAKPIQKPAKKITKISPSRQTSLTIVPQASAAQPPLREPLHRMPAEQETMNDKSGPDTISLVETVPRGARKATKTYSATTKSSKAGVKIPPKQHTSSEERVSPPKEPITPQPISADVEVDLGQNMESSRTISDISSEFASSPRQSSPPVLEPKSAKTWGVLLGDGGETSKKGKESARETAAKSMKPVRRRLIDTLVQQKAQAARESSSQEADDTDIATPSAVRPAIEMEPSTQSNSASMSQPPTNGVPAAPMTPGPRITYSRQRSMLAEQDDLLGDIHMEMGGSLSLNENSQNRRGYAPSLKSFESSIAKEFENDFQTAPAIRSVHELRQAGASKRFMDEIDDLSDRITTISAKPSIRRSALLELLDKVQDRTFLRNFLSSGAEHKVLATMNEETDPVCAFLFGSVILLLLDPTTAKLSAARLVGLGFVTFCRRLLQTNESIVSIAKQRRTNMSKMFATTIADCHRKLLDLPIWADARPKFLSPRTVGLACLALCLPQMPGKASLQIYVSKDMAQELFSILESCIAPSLEMGNTTAQCDLLLSTSILGHCYFPDVSGSDQPQWGSEYLREICCIATKLLVLEGKETASLRKVVLSLTLNITNNNGHATDVFATQDFMQTIIRSVCSEFDQVSDAASETDRLASIDALILMLGITINLVEKVDSDASILDGSDVKQALLIFSDHVAKSFEADSVEDTHFNVVFGYLAVLLGYLSLMDQLANPIRHGLPGRNLKSLIEAIKEFIYHHQQVDALSQNDTTNHRAHAALTERLSRMLRKVCKNEAYLAS